MNFDSLAGGFQPRIRIFYNAPEPGFYVFDFTVESTALNKPADLLFTNFYSVSETKSLGKGIQHQVFVTEFKSAGWHLFSLESKSSWNFYAAEISQYK